MSQTETLGRCLYCGNELVQIAGRKPKKYCSGTCRTAMWHKQKNAEIELHPGDDDVHICVQCGRAFFAYGKRKRKYCSHECYIKWRFGTVKAETDSESSCEEEGSPFSGCNEEVKKTITEEDLALYRNNPYVSSATIDRVELTEGFYCAAGAFLDMGIDTVFDIFGINTSNFTEKELSIISELMLRRRKAGFKEEIPEKLRDEWLRIAVKRVAVLSRSIEESLADIGALIKGMSTAECKEICLMVQKLPKDPKHIFTTSRMLSAMGISRNSYYCYVKDERYGLSVEMRDAMDEPYVRRAFEYKGFKKGARLVYMLLPMITGRKIGLDRIRRIMRKYGMESGVRQANEAKRAAGRYLEEHRKPNLLKRMFRLHRPNEVRITDVTYLEYGNGRKAYGSALMDPVTDVLVAFVVSARNDLELAMETLRKSDSHPCINGGIFHSDQGSLYLSPEFQKEVAKLGFVQSMSKRGNCWDNAPQESFFGHFKDECDYSACTNIEQLRGMVQKYSFYYNNERGLWDRKHMTPLKYEEYLLSLTDEEYTEYMKREEIKYERMKERAAQKAKERAKTLGV